MDRFKLYFEVRNEGLTDRLDRLDVRSEEQRINCSSLVLGLSNLEVERRLLEDQVWVSVVSFLKFQTHKVSFAQNVILGGSLRRSREGGNYGH